MDERPSVLRLILVPSVVSLAVTLVRLYGELRRWPEPLFSREAGGGFSPLGISWLGIVFAIYFALRLETLGLGPSRRGRAAGFAFAALALWLGGIALIFPLGQGPAPGQGNMAALVAGMVVVGAALQVVRSGWPEYGDVLLAYALAVRLPVVAVMLAAIRGDWGTHYDVAPHTMQWTWSGWFRKFVDIGLIPQLFLWIPYTVVACGLFGLAALGLRRRVRGR